MTDQHGPERRGADRRAAVRPAAAKPSAARVLIVDDHPDVRQGIRAVLATEPTLRVVGEAASGDDALGVALVLRPDLIVLDHEMPGTRGLDVLPKLRVILPAARVVMFTMSSNISSQAALRGAEAVVTKDDLPGLVGTLRRLAETRAQPRPSPRRGTALGRGPFGRAAIVAGLALLYIAAFMPLVELLGTQAIDLAILVVAVAGAVYGLRGGLVAAALALPVNALLIRVAGLAVPGAGSVSRVAIAVAIGAAFGRLRDVTAHAQAQARSLADTSAALEASDQRLLGLLENAPLILVSIDPDGVIVDALGAGFGDRPKFSPELMRGQQAAVWYADDGELLARLSRALSGERLSERVERDGVVYDLHLRPRHDRTGAFIGTTGVLVNLGAPTP